MSNQQNEIPRTETVYRVYARQKGCAEWIPQESSENGNEVVFWAKRNNDRNAREFEEGAGREFIAVRATTTFELL